jgi:hypothetical protein
MRSNVRHGIAGRRSGQRRNEPRLRGWRGSFAAIQRCLDTLAKARPLQIQGLMEIAYSPGA